MTGISSKIIAAANQNIKERDYWLQKFDTDVIKSFFPYDMHKDSGAYSEMTYATDFGIDITKKILELSGGTDIKIYLIMFSVLNILLYKMTNSEDVILGSPVITNTEAAINTILAIRTNIDPNQNFKETLLKTRENVLEAFQFQNYPYQLLLESLRSKKNDQLFDLFDVFVVYENLHQNDTLKFVNANIIFNFKKEDDRFSLELTYNQNRYSETAVNRICTAFQNLLANIFLNFDMKLNELSILSCEENNKLLFEFNDSDSEIIYNRNLHEIFEEQVRKNPERIAVICSDRKITYGELNTNANKLARRLLKAGITKESIVAILMEKSEKTITAMIAILKAGGAYLPIDPDLPNERVLYMLKDAGVNIVLSESEIKDKIEFTLLKDIETEPKNEVVVTAPRPYIKDINTLPYPSRKLIDLSKYKGKIGMASVTNCISLQSTRGCPYQCVYCHKVWSKNHVYRDAENLYAEIEYYYKQGVKNFSFLDDCFNLNAENSSKLFHKIIQNKLDVNLYFPNGLRGDLLTPEYIDRMVEAGTKNINLSLETASPRLQRLVKKHLDLDQFKYAMDYISTKHPGVILELATMHGFPTETEEEALMTLEFIFGIKWIHFPYIHILKIYPNTEMEELALRNGVLKKDILYSKDLAYHELPETLPFPKRFTRMYQSRFLNEYILSSERLQKVLPVQMSLMSKDALIEKYNSYLPTEITTIEDILKLANLSDDVLPEYAQKERESIRLFEEKHEDDLIPASAKRILFLDLSLHFSEKGMLYKVSEQPLGGMYILTYLKEIFKDQIDGKIYKSGIDFNSYAELQELCLNYKPDLILVRSLTFYKELFHETVSFIRQIGITAPIITGGPYATSDYITILNDVNIDLVVLGEGEQTVAEIVKMMLKNSFMLPSQRDLEQIKGIVFSKGNEGKREVLLLDWLESSLSQENGSNLELSSHGNDLAYVMYTSGSTGNPKGVMVEHKQVNNCISWMQKKFKLTEDAMVIQRTNLTFDPSVWEIFWPLYIGATAKVLDQYQSKDVQFLLDLMEDPKNSVMYCPASLVQSMVYYLSESMQKRNLQMPWLIIGAEPISVNTINDLYKHYCGTIVNTYGPTECTINNTFFEIVKDHILNVIPIGRPIDNNNIYILSENQQLVPIGQIGEIWIGGASVARGYINNLPKTVESFVDNPFGEGKIYKTGDLARWTDDGLIEILGRKDSQIKIRGYRIELGEIENQLKQHPQVTNCLVTIYDKSKQRNKIKKCKRCGIPSNYPGVKITEDEICEDCLNYKNYSSVFEKYFKNLEELQSEIAKINENSQSPYDCCLIYNGGKGAAYALYKLAEMGLKVLVLTIDNGFFSKAHLERVKSMVAELGFDHRIEKSEQCSQIIKESMKSIATPCKGCFLASSSLAGKIALENNIKIVIGATLSRGQIIENKLYSYLKIGITDVEEIEKRGKEVLKNGPILEKEIFKFIRCAELDDGSMYDNVLFIDFYRYCAVSNHEIIDYLNNKNPYWKKKKNTALYSTNCPIKQHGDYGHLMKYGYHYYGKATYWVKRLGYLSHDELIEDLQCKIQDKSYQTFLKQLGLSAQLAYADQSLCAYFTVKKDVEIEEIKNYLNEKLPQYMLPSYFMKLAEFPINSNGKVDTDKLPEPEKNILNEQQYEAPRNDVETKLAQIWQEVLEYSPIGINDNFFELGGHSLKAISLTSKIAKEMGIAIPLKMIFENQTIKAMAESMEKDMFETTSSHIKKVENKEYYSTSAAQRRMYILQQMNKNNTSYNVPMILKLEGEVDKIKIEQCFIELIEHHESFRTYFEEFEEDVVQKITKEIEFSVESIVLGNTSISDKISEFIRVFDLSTAPLVRVGLIKIKEREYLLIVDMHHIISDGVSLGVLTKDFTDLYAGRKLEQLQIQYKDYAEWQQLMIKQGEYKKYEDFWLKEFAGQIPVLNLPTDYPRSQVLDYMGSSLEFEIEQVQYEKLKNLCRTNGATLYTVLLSLYKILLQKYTDQEEIIVGSVVANRKYPGLEKIVGVFINTVAIKSYVKPDDSYENFLNTLQEKIKGVMDNQGYEFEELVQKLNIDKSSGRNPLFDVMFMLQNFDMKPVELEGIRVSSFPYERKVAKFDLTLVAREMDNRLAFSIEYATQLFAVKTIQKMKEHFVEIMAMVTENPVIKLKDINLSFDENYAETEVEWNEIGQITF